MSELKLQQCRVDGRYDVLDCLGRGSYSEVYVARDLAAADGAPQMVVLKALNQYLQGEPDPDLEQTLVDNFRNEAVALDRVRHPNIISRLGHGTAIDLQGRVFHYLVVEYLPGGDMQQLCRRRPLKLEGALFYLKQVASGLEHAHERDVIHRDIKPQNLLLTADQHVVKIADFGVAKIEAADGAITRVGTDLYAAPEHHPLRHTGPLDTASLTRPSQLLTPAADVYSLAKTAFTLLTGDSPRRFSQRPVSELPAPFSQEPWAPYVLRVLERATQTSAAKRYQSVREFWEDLQDASMPRTQVLGSSHAPDDAPRVDKDLDDAASVTPPPPAPAFKEQAEPSAGERAKSSSHLRIVVPVALESVSERATPQTHAAPPPPQRTEPQAHEVARAAPPARRSRLSAGMKKWLVALLLILAFAGMLFATHFYFTRGQQQQRTSAPPTAPAASAVGRRLVATHNVNLRSAPGRNGEVKGKVPRDSVVEVLSANGGWYRVQVVQYSQPKENSDYADQGWADRDYFKERQ